MRAQATAVTTALHSRCTFPAAQVNNLGRSPITSPLIARRDTDLHGATAIDGTTHKTHLACIRLGAAGHDRIHSHNRNH